MNVRKKFSGQYLVVSIFISVLVLGMFAGFGFEYLKMKEYTEEIASLNKDIKEADRQIESLKSSNAFYSDDLELMARVKLNMVKSSDIVYVDINNK